MAETELEKMRMECESKASIQLLLDGEVRSLRTQINDLLLRNYDLEKE